MAQSKSERDTDPAARRDGVRRWLAIAVLSALMGAGIGVAVDRLVAYPRLEEVVGMVDGFDDTGEKFAFKPDEGTPLSYSIGQADGVEFLRPGGRVVLTLVYLSADKYVVGEIAPAPG